MQLAYSFNTDVCEITFDKDVVSTEILVSKELGAIHFDADGRVVKVQVYKASKTLPWQYWNFCDELAMGPDIEEEPLFAKIKSFFKHKKGA